MNDNPTTTEQLIASNLALRHILRQTLFLVSIHEKSEADRHALFDEVRKKAIGNIPNTPAHGPDISTETVALQTEAYINDFFDSIARN